MLVAPRSQRGRPQHGGLHGGGGLIGDGQPTTLATADAHLPHLPRLPHLPHRVTNPPCASLRHQHDAYRSCTRFHAAQKLEIYYDPSPFLSSLTAGGKCPLGFGTSSSSSSSSSSPANPSKPKEGGLLGGLLSFLK